RQASASIMGLIFIFIIGIFDDAKASHVLEGWRVLLESEASAKGGLSEVRSAWVPVFNCPYQAQCPFTPQNIVHFLLIQNAVANPPRQSNTAGYESVASKAGYSSATLGNLVVRRSLRKPFALQEQNRLIIDPSDTRYSSADINKIEINFERTAEP